MTLDPFVFFFKLCLPLRPRPTLGTYKIEKNGIHTEAFIFNTLTVNNNNNNNNNKITKISLNYEGCGCHH